ERENDGEEEDALVDPAAADPLVQLVREQEAERRRDEGEDSEPDQVVLHSLPERRIDRGDLAVVLGAHPVRVRDPADPVPVREREQDRPDRREPDQAADDDRRHADHHADGDAIAARETDGAPLSTRAARSHPRCEVDRHRLGPTLLAQTPKISFFCFWLLLTRPLTSFGWFSNCCSA